MIALKKVLSAVLTAALLVSTVPAAFAASDIDGHWAKSYITELHENGIINPSASTGNYGPDDKVTRWEFMRYINRAFGFTEKADISFSDVNSSDISTKPCRLRSSRAISTVSATTVWRRRAR
ncbi:S-layer homology domain-containing protein [Butyricicoccus sp. OF10-2]|nr:S-layer homology domain-containing protein [Butyricicoccus sp. OF10-2]